MALSDLVTPERIVTLKSRTKRGALRELVSAACGSVSDLAVEPTFEAVWAREELVSSWVDEGLAIPHARLPNLDGFVVTVGRSASGVAYECADGRPVHLLLLILGPEQEPEQHLLLLAEVARALRFPELRERIVAARTRRQARDLLVHGAREEPGRRPATSVGHGLLGHALALARETSARAVLVDVDGLRSPDALRRLPSDVEVLLVTQGRVPVPPDLAGRHRTVLTPFSGLSRGSQRSLTLLLALSQGLLRPGDRVVNLYGLPGADTVDTLAVVDVPRELPSFSPPTGGPLLGDVEAPVLARVIQLAADLAREGREGHPVGTVFVVGDHAHVRGLTSQLVINPFRGYRDEEKNVLDPSLEETVKEFSAIDGAFLIRGDGVIEAAGAYLRPDGPPPRLASGLGTRHAAAAGLTSQTRAMAVVLSQSTGRVSLFKGGTLVTELRRARSE